MVGGNDSTESKTIPVSGDCLFVGLTVLRYLRGDFVEPADFGADLDASSARGVGRRIEPLT